ncbi:MAG: bifunctional folylpolyglutamate synthase/dihydrofolate synthase [Flammeovirgaceae bacterium]|nr:MAG: bifunctional folylpolyglutamate synthase/dihydrofolate synthase [Flammeovirgaceae bacterium]
MLTSYHQALDFLYATLPMYQRVGAVAYKKDLTNTLALCNELDQPQNKFKSVHIAGTNGKGSSSHMIASVLQEAGYKTGLYTSPHLKSFTERIRINGQEVYPDFVVGFVNRMRSVIEKIKPSFFETTVAMAFDYFARQQVDIAVVEVGLGGRLDSTNVITPLVSLITNIGFDHTDMLGETLSQIAVEKAGIIKPDTPVVISEQQDETTPVFLQKANECKAPIFFAQDEYQVTKNETGYHVLYQGVVRFKHLKLALGGNYQQKNLYGVLKTLDVLRQRGFAITDEHIINGLEMVTTNTGLKGRWQILGTMPLIICDTAHNAEGLNEVVDQIRQQPHRALYIVFGMVRDKQPEKILSMLPKEATYFFCQAHIPRAMDAGELMRKAEAFGLTGTVVPDVNQAITLAKALATSDDLIFIGGSTFVVAEINDL